MSVVQCKAVKHDVTSYGFLVDKLMADDLNLRGVVLERSTSAFKW